LLFFAAHQQSCSSPAATASRRRGNYLSATAKYLQKTTSGAAGIGLGTTIKYRRRTTSGATGNVLSITIKYLKRKTSGAVDNGRAKLSSTCDAQRAKKQLPVKEKWPFGAGQGCSGRDTLGFYQA
jgi:hypothetical protein